MGLGPQDSTLFNQLFDQGKFKQRIFGIGLGFTNQPSSIRLGGIDKNYMKDPSNIKWADVQPNPNWWTLTITGASFNGKSMYAGWTNQAIVDSGTTLLAMESTDMQTWINELNSVTTGLTETQNGIFYYNGACPDAPDYHVTVGSTTLTVPSTQYLEEIQGFCMVRVQQTGFASLYILGDVVMRNYYCIFDGANQRVGFSPIKYPKSEEEEVEETALFLN